MNLIDKYIKENNFSNIDYIPEDNKIAVIIETRNIPNLEWTINNIQYYTKWKVRIYCSNNSNINGIKLNNVEKVIINDINSFKDYNNLLKSLKFWESFDEDHILIFQSDSFMLNHGINEFIKYDYIGAPWNWAYDDSFSDARYMDLTIFRNGGNGGFSLRKRSKMIEIIKNYDTSEYENEDMFFSSHLYDNYIDINIKKRFSVETIFYENPIAVHSIDKYLNYKQIEKILF